MTTPDAAFLPGLELAGILYEEGVRPLLDDAYPGLRYAAARVGGGSEVLGFDTARSTDHDWGPQLDLFLGPDDAAEHGAAIHRILADRLPKTVRGWPTHFRQKDDPRDPVGHMEPTDGPVNHRVSTRALGPWLARTMGTDPLTRALTTQDWLAVPQQRLAEVTGGSVFHDGLGTLTAVRRELAWYPDQLWRYLLACQWQRISQEEAFVGRCAEAGDDLGSAVVVARLVRDLMRLCLLLERRYAPYSKWLGSAFARLDAAKTLTAPLRGALTATGYQEREEHLCAAYEAVASLQNSSGLTEPVDPARRRYHSRSFMVLHAERFTQALVATLKDPDLQGIPLTGNVDQWADSTDFLGRQGPVRAATNELMSGPATDID